MKRHTWLSGGGLRGPRTPEEEATRKRVNMEDGRAFVIALIGVASMVFLGLVCALVSELLK